MIEIKTNPLGVVCIDAKCKDQEEVFPPYRTYDFSGGRTLFGADGKSFFISKDRSAYSLDGTIKPYQDFLNDLNTALITIENGQ